MVGLKLHLSTLGRLGFALAGLLAVTALGSIAFHLCDQPIRQWLTNLRPFKTRTGATGLRLRRR